MLGRQIADELEKNKLSFVATDMDVDITNRSSLSEFAAGKGIKWIINCSAYTAVDKAESDEAKAELINGTGAANIASVAASIEAKVIHFSTDYVFDGEKNEPYTPDDPACPASVYGKTKLSGEQQLQRLCSQYFIFRIAWLYGIHGSNFVKTMLRLFADRDSLGVIDDQYGTPTYCGTLAKNIAGLLVEDSEKYGIYHYTDEGKISWYDFANQIKTEAMARSIKINDTTIKAIPTEEYPTPARRPKNSYMDKSKVINELGFEVHNWKENLSAYFNEDELRS